MDLLKMTTRMGAAGVQITFLVGIMYLAFGALQLGFIANFLSHAITSGFSSGAAVVIGLSQLKYFFGISTAPSHTGLGTAIELIKHIKETQWREVLMFTAFFVLLLGMKELSSRVPRLHWTKPLGPISICILGIVAVVIGDLDGKKLVKTVHRIPRGELLERL
jgi:sulfate transporter 4